MSRFKKLRDWPDNLQRLSPDELRKELAYWRMRIRISELRSHHKSFEKRIREIERELDARGSRTP